MNTLHLIQFFKECNYLERGLIVSQQLLSWQSSLLAFSSWLRLLPWREARACSSLRAATRAQRWKAHSCGVFARSQTSNGPISPALEECELHCLLWNLRSLRGLLGLSRLTPSKAHLCHSRQRRSNLRLRYPSYQFPHAQGSSISHS